MNEQECSCEWFERLEGVAIEVYIRDFLKCDDSDGEAAGEKTYYTCRKCSAQWALIPEKPPREAQLVRLETKFNV